MELLRQVINVVILLSVLIPLISCQSIFPTPTHDSTSLYPTTDDFLFDRNSPPFASLDSITDTITTTTTTTTFNPQQSHNQLLSIRLFPAVDKKTSVSVPFHGHIVCRPEDEITTSICVNSLGLTIHWKEDTKTTVASSTWFQVFVPDGYNETHPLVREHAPTSVTGSVIAFSIFDSAGSDGDREKLQKLYFIGEINWRRLSHENLVLTFYLRELSNIRGRISQTVPRYDRDSNRNLDLLEDTSYLGTHVYYPHLSKLDGRVSFQYWIQNIPFQYSTVFIQQVGWVQPPQNSPGAPKIQCVLNGAETVVELQICSPPACPTELTLGFNATAINPLSLQVLTFPATTDFALNCTGLKLFSPLNFKDSPAIAIQVQVLPSAQKDMSVDSLEPSILSKRLIRTAIINPPIDNLAPEFTNRFGFFALNSTNRPTYFLTPRRPLSWTGNSRQPLTNGPICYSHYYRRFFLRTATLQPIAAIPVHISLESTKSASFYTGTWTLQKVTENDKSSVAETEFFQKLIYKKPGKKGTPDWYDSTSHLRFEDIVLSNIPAPTPNVVYELLISLGVECNDPGEEFLSTLVVSYDQNEVKSIDHHNTIFRLVHAASWSPNRHFDSTQFRFQANRVNLTEVPLYHDIDIATWTYRFTFTVTITHLPLDVSYWSEPHLEHPRRFLSQLGPNQPQTPVFNDPEIVVPNQVYDQVRVDETTGLQQTVQSFDSRFGTKPANNDGKGYNVQYKSSPSGSTVFKRLFDHTRNLAYGSLISKEQFETERDEGSDLSQASIASAIKMTDTTTQLNRQAKLSSSTSKGTTFTVTPNDFDNVSDDDDLNNAVFTTTQTPQAEEGKAASGTLKWIELSFPGDTYIFHGDFENCTINGEQVTPKAIDEDGTNLFHIARNSFTTSLGFSYDFSASSQSSGSSSQLQGTHYILQCFDVFLVNFTDIDFQTTAVPDRNWFDSENPLSLSSPQSTAVYAYLSHYPRPLNASNYYLLGTVAEFDARPDDPLFFAALIIVSVMLGLSLLLFSLWVYAGTQHGANNQIHRSDRTKQILHKSRSSTPAPSSSGVNHSRYERMQ